MPNQYNIDHERNKQVIQSYLSGNSLDKVGLQFGLCREVVRQVTNRAGVTRSHSKKRAVLTDAIRLGVIEAYDAGQPTKQIGESFGVSQASVGNILKSEGRVLTRKHLTDHYKDLLLSGYLNGKSTYELERETGFSNVIISKTLKHLGIEKRSPLKISNELANQITINYQEGESSESIAKRLSLSATCIRSTLKRKGVMIRQVWPIKEKPPEQLFDPNFLPQQLPECTFAGIYKFTNKINGKIYIGQSRNIYKRYYQHREMRAPGMFTKALKKYGIGNFKLEVVERVTNFTELDKREQYWLNYYKSYVPEIGYNIRKIVGYESPKKDGKPP